MGRNHQTRGGPTFPGVGFTGRRPLLARLTGTRLGLWAAFAAVLVPLAVLLVLQYRWLVDLEHSSTIARHTSLGKYLEVVGKEVEYVYGTSAERVLNVPASVLSREMLPKLAAFFAKRKVEGFKRLFVVAYDSKEGLYVFDAERVEMVVPEWNPETIAIWAATSPWKYLHKKGGRLETTMLSVDERDPDHRIILNPITDEKWKLVGLAGAVVDQRWFEDEVLPKVITSSLPKLFEEGKLVVSVRDQRGRLVWPSPRDAAAAGDDVVTRPFRFVFTDWKISLGGGAASPEQWARSNFALNVSLSVALAVVLLGGVVLALRTASREMRLCQMKGEFVSNVSHELRTPLASIRVFGELLRLGKVTEPEKVREYGEYIETESRRLTQLINNILDFSRIESGRKIYSFEEADLEEVVAETVATFARRLRTVGLRSPSTGRPTSLPPMRLDTGAIDQAVANLLDNAVKYSDGGTEVAVGARAREDGRRHLGHGPRASGSRGRAGADLRALPPGHHRPGPRRQGQRASGSPSSSTSWALTRVGRRSSRAGARQHLLDRAADRARARSGDPDRGGVAWSAKVLVVEDDEAMAVALRDGFTYEGYEVVVAGDGVAALEAVERHRPDLVILDVMLPRMTGLDVCKRMRGAGNAIPIIMLTARGQEIDKVLGLKLGADDYVTKPFSFMELMARVEAVLRRTGGGGREAAGRVVVRGRRGGLRRPRGFEGGRAGRAVPARAAPARASSSSTAARW